MRQSEAGEFHQIVALGSGSRFDSSFRATGAWELVRDDAAKPHFPSAVGRRAAERCERVDDDGVREPRTLASDLAEDR